MNIGSRTLRSGLLFGMCLICADAFPSTKPDELRMEMLRVAQNSLLNIETYRVQFLACMRTYSYEHYKSSGTATEVSEAAVATCSLALDLFSDNTRNFHYMSDCAETLRNCEYLKARAETTAAREREALAVRGKGEVIRDVIEARDAIQNSENKNNAESEVATNASKKSMQMLVLPGAILGMVVLAAFLFRGMFTQRRHHAGTLERVGIKEPARFGASGWNTPNIRATGRKVIVGLSILGFLVLGAYGMTIAPERIISVGIKTFGGMLGLFILVSPYYIWTYIKNRRMNARSGGASD